MRMRELSRHSGVPVATIKYWIQEGLVPPGTPTAPNQATYTEAHLERLRVIVALREGAGLGIAALRRVFRTVDGAEESGEHYLTTAIRALTEPPSGDEPEPEAEPGRDEAIGLVDGLVEAVGWDVDADSAGRADLVQAVAAVRRWMPGLIDEPDDLAPFAKAMRQLAEIEIPAAYDPEGDPQALLTYAVLGTALFEPVILALRKLGHVDRHRELARARKPLGA
jgi:DNA-binding transcriptional MerR regulator